MSMLLMLTATVLILWLGLVLFFDPMDSALQDLIGATAGQVQSPDMIVGQLSAGSERRKPRSPPGQSRALKEDKVMAPVQGSSTSAVDRRCSASTNGDLANMNQGD
jgi:hypothetical protein